MLHEMSEFFLLCLHFFLFLSLPIHGCVLCTSTYILYYVSIQRPLPHIIFSVTQKLNKHLIFHTNTFIYFLNIFSEQYTVRLKVHLRFLYAHNFTNLFSKGQLISKGLFKIFISTTKRTKIF